MKFLPHPSETKSPICFSIDYRCWNEIFFGLNFWLNHSKCLKNHRKKFHFKCSWHSFLILLDFRFVWTDFPPPSSSNDSNYSININFEFETKRFWWLCFDFWKFFRSRFDLFSYRSIWGVMNRGTNFDKIHRFNMKSDLINSDLY